MGRSGTEISNSLLDKSGAEREALVWAALVNEEIPSYLADKSKWPEIVVSGTDTLGNPHTLVIRAAPRPVETGTDEDAFLHPMQPETADRYARKRNSILASQKLIDDIWNFAILKLPISPPPGFKIPGPDMVDPRSWIAHNKIIQSSLAGSQALMAGGVKLVVSGPGLDGTRVAIYSSPFSGSGSPRPSGYPPRYQGYSTIHWVSHVDWAHGTRLIDRQARLNGNPVDLMSIFVDPVLHTLVSDQGMFTPEFPNMSGSGTSKFSVASEPDKSAPIADPPHAYSVTKTGEVIFNPQAVEEDTKASKIGMVVGGVVGVGLSLVFGFGLLAGGVLTAGGVLLGRRAGPRARTRIREATEKANSQ
jgi:hypothetical protein